MQKANKILTDELYQKMKNGAVDMSWWRNISECYILSEEIIKEFDYRWDWATSWYRISTHQTLSKSFIREYKEDVDWWSISKFQDISYEFIIEFADKINIKYLKQNKYIHFTRNQWRTIKFMKKIAI